VEPVDDTRARDAPRVPQSDLVDNGPRDF